MGLVAGSPVCVAGGVVSHAPIRHLPKLAGAMTVISGAGLLSQVIERGKAGSCGFASSPGAWRPVPVCGPSRGGW